MRFAIYDRWDAYVGEMEALSATWEVTLSGIDQLTVKTLRDLERGWQVVWRDVDGTWHENTIDDVTTVHRGGRAITTAICINSIRETMNDYIDDIVPRNVSAEIMLTRCMQASGTRWQLGPTDVEGLQSKTFYHQSLREAIADIADEYGGETETSIEVSERGVAARYVGIRAARGTETQIRLTYGKNTKGIERRILPYEGKSALYGYGMGVETDTGGYGRRLKLTEANPTGLDYIEEPALIPLYGRPGADGGRVHSYGSVIYERVTDPYTLYDLTNEALHSQVPPVTYTCDLAEVSALRGCSVGDTVTVADSDFPTPLRLRARVTRIFRDLLADDTGGTIEIGTESRTLSDIVSEQNSAIAAVDSASIEATVNEFSEIQPDHFYMYHGENKDALSVSNETNVVAMKFATVADTRVAVNFTVEHVMNLDGDVIARIYINGTLMKELETYEARGNALLDFMWSSDFAKDMQFDLLFTLEPVGVVSQIRENDADNATLWNRSRANSQVTWDEVLATETWDSFESRTWDAYATGTTKAGTWDWLLHQGQETWDVVEPSTTKPTISIAPKRAQAVLFGRGLAAVESWDGQVDIYETVPLFSLVQKGLAIGYSAEVATATETPRRAALTDAIGLSLMRAGIALGYSDAVEFGEDAETVWANDLVYDSAAVTASGGTWYATGAATVETVDFGTDRTVGGVASVAVASTGSIVFSVSFDGGGTWLAYNGSAWVAGTMGADDMNAITDWPAPPLRFRMSMGAGARVNGMTINYERS